MQALATPWLQSFRDFPVRQKARELPPRRGDGEAGNDVRNGDRT
jgi:hypothetical protein